MTTPADILDALGRHDAAALLRWGEAREPSELEIELAEQLDTEADNCDRLEELLCKRCAATWAGKRK